MTKARVITPQSLAVVNIVVGALLGFYMYANVATLQVLYYSGPLGSIKRFLYAAGMVAFMLPFLPMLVLAAECRWLGCKKMVWPGLSMTLSAYVCMGVFVGYMDPALLVLGSTGLAIGPGVAWLMTKTRLVPRAYSYPDCLACGYDLTGNTSGTCPECGAEIDGQ